MKKFIILTLFPNMFENFINTSIIKKAINKKIISINIFNIREFSNLKNQKVDDYSYGGGNGMVLMVEPIYNAINKLKNNNSFIILLTPQGKRYNQKIAKYLSEFKEECEENNINNKKNFINNKEIILICGHYEGFDERILNYIDMELSIGDYILTGGEIASMVIIDSVTRLTGIIKKNSYLNDSFSFKDYLLDFPVYTKPKVFDKKSVPEVLLSGNHKKIDEWRRFKSFEKTYFNRPDLLKNINFSIEEKKWINIIQKKNNKY